MLSNILYFCHINTICMNRFLLVIAILLFNANVFAQVEGNYNYSIGIRGYSLMQLPKIAQQTNTDDFTNVWLSGGMLKLNDNQMAFRISGYYLYKRDYSFNNQCETCESAVGNLNDFSVKIGFEKNFNYSIIQPYFATDFGFRSTSFKGTVKQVNSSSLKRPYSLITSKNGGTVTPVLGLKVNISKQLSLFTESSLDFFYFYERQETVLGDAAETRTFAKYYKFEALLNPVSVGLQLHLVRKN